MKGTQLTRTLTLYYVPSTQHVKERLTEALRSSANWSETIAIIKKKRLAKRMQSGMRGAGVFAGQVEDDDDQHGEAQPQEPDGDPVEEIGAVGKDRRSAAGTLSGLDAFDSARTIFSRRFISRLRDGQDQQAPDALIRALPPADAHFEDLPADTKAALGRIFENIFGCWLRREERSQEELTDDRAAAAARQRTHRRKKKSAAEKVRLFASKVDTLCMQLNDMLTTHCSCERKKRRDWPPQRAGVDN